MLIAPAESGDGVAMGDLSDYREDLERLALDGSLTAAHYLAKMYEGGLGVPAEDKRRGLRTFNRFNLAREALHRDWCKAST